MKGNTFLVHCSKSGLPGDFALVFGISWKEHELTVISLLDSSCLATLICIGVHSLIFVMLWTRLTCFVVKSCFVLISGVQSLSLVMFWPRLICCVVKSCFVLTSGLNISVIFLMFLFHVLLWFSLLWILAHRKVILSQRYGKFEMGYHLPWLNTFVIGMGQFQIVVVSSWDIL